MEPAWSQQLARTPRGTKIAIGTGIALVFLLVLSYGRRIGGGLLASTHTVVSELDGLHPVLRLHRQAQQDHDDFLRRQSQTFEDAVANYSLRYECDPPSSFEAWFNKAREMRSPVIDDFDTVFSQVEPFAEWKLNGTAPAGHLWTQKLLRICVRDGEMKLDGFQEDWFTDALHSILDDFIGEFPDLCVYMNTLDEPRSIPLPYSELATDDAMASHHTEGVTFFTTSDHGNLFTEATLPCLLPGSEPDRATRLRQHHHQDSIFVDDFFEATDLCNYNRSLAHGLVSSPETASFTHDPVPILSNAKLSTFGDILFPSLWRFEHANKADLDKDFVPDDHSWESKSKTLYWRGSTTGGHGQVGRHLHRQELIKHIHSVQPNSSAIRPEVGFTDIIQCEDAECEAMKATFPTANREPLSAGWKHQFLLDVDGNGLSGRLYDLLGSNSVVVRHTMLREWHDERLRPWLHFVPLSPGAQELRELLEFFGTPEGDTVARTIAEESKKWAEASLRREDQKLYLWRLFLEVAGKRQSAANTTIS